MTVFADAVALIRYKAGNVGRIRKVAAVLVATSISTATSADQGTEIKSPVNLTPIDKRQEYTNSDMEISDILARPLFSVTRHPPTMLTKVTQVPIPRLAGVIISKSDRIAILDNKFTAHSSFLREGADFEGWKLGTILPSRVQITGNGNTQWLLPTHQTPTETFLERRIWQRMRHRRPFPGKRG